MRLLNLLRKVLCSRHVELRRHNAHGVWLACPYCHWESDGWEIQ